MYFKRPQKMHLNINAYGHLLTFVTIKKKKTDQIFFFLFLKLIPTLALYLCVYICLIHFKVRSSHPKPIAVGRLIYFKPTVTISLMMFHYLNKNKFKKQKKKKN